MTRLAPCPLPARLEGKSRWNLFLIMLDGKFPGRMSQSLSGASLSSSLGRRKWYRQENIQEHLVRNISHEEKEDGTLESTQTHWKAEWRPKQAGMEEWYVTGTLRYVHPLRIMQGREALAAKVSPAGSALLKCVSGGIRLENKFDVTFGGLVWGKSQFLLVEGVSVGDRPPHILFLHAGTPIYTDGEAAALLPALQTTGKTSRDHPGRSQFEEEHPNSAGSFPSVYQGFPIILDCWLKKETRLLHFNFVPKFTSSTRPSIEENIRLMPLPGSSEPVSTGK